MYLFQATHLLMLASECDHVNLLFTNLADQHKGFFLLSNHGPTFTELFAIYENSAVRHPSEGATRFLSNFSLLIFSNILTFPYSVWLTTTCVTAPGSPRMIIIKYICLHAYVHTHLKKFSSLVSEGTLNASIKARQDVKKVTIGIKQN